MVYCSSEWDIVPAYSQPYLVAALFFNNLQTVRINQELLTLKLLAPIKPPLQQCRSHVDADPQK